MANSIASLHFLVAEDSAAMRQVIVAQLREFGATHVIAASNGQEALSALQKGAIDLVVSDFNMPVMSGLDLLRAMRADPTLKSTPVLMITSENNGGQLKAVVQSGVTQILMKPYTMNQLEVKLSATLRHVKRKPPPPPAEE